MPARPELLAAAARDAGLTLDGASLRAVGGGDISAAYRVTDSAGRDWFLKVNDSGFADAFAAEQAGLAELSRADGLRVPAVAGAGVSGAQAWLLLEWLDMQRGNEAAAAALGSALAGMHRITQAEHGWHRNNYIGSTPQQNMAAASWSVFYGESRLRPQIELAATNGAPVRFANRALTLIDELPTLLRGYEPQPSLLHGDLWGGNWAQLPGGDPVLFDPAVYFGDRETDLAMTRLFGGFPASFYTAYEAGWPLEPGYDFRCTLYQFYHVLNHFNLFGGGYLSQADTMLDTLLGGEKQ